MYAASALRPACRRMLSGTWAPAEAASGDASEEPAKDAPVFAPLAVGASCDVVEATSVDSETACRPLAVAGVAGDCGGEDLGAAWLARFVTAVFLTEEVADFGDAAPRHATGDAAGDCRGWRTAEDLGDFVFVFGDCVVINLSSLHT